MHHYVLICFVLFCAGFAHGLSGFASILLSVPVLALFLNIKIVIPLVALSTFSMTLMLLIQLRHHLDWKRMYPLLIGGIPGIATGVFLLKELDQKAMQWGLGLILIAYAAYALFSRSPKGRIRAGWALLFGFFSGCVGGALSAPGPPIVVYTSLQNWDKDDLKGSLQACWFIIFLIVITLHALTGLTTIEVLRFYGVSLPFLLLGTYVGSLFYGMISEDQYKKLVLTLIGLLGALMIYRA